jgi:hypothetical protein
MIYYQVACSLSWFSVALILLPAAYRVIRGKPVDGDEWKAIISGIGALFGMFALRWVFWGEDLQSWKMLYVMAILMAIVTVLTIFNHRKK